MGRFPAEILKFLYCILIAFAGILAFAFVIDLLSLAIAGQWQWELGRFPAVSGTIRSLSDSGLFYSLSLLIGSGGIARMIMGSTTPFFLAQDEKSDF